VRAMGRRQPCHTLSHLTLKVDALCFSDAVGSIFETKNYHQQDSSKKFNTFELMWSY
jgi:hypothetical protein